MLVPVLLVEEQKPQSASDTFALMQQWVGLDMMAEVAESRSLNSGGRIDLTCLQVMWGKVVLLPFVTVLFSPALFELRLINNGTLRRQKCEKIKE